MTTLEHMYLLFLNLSNVTGVSITHIFTETYHDYFHAFYLYDIINVVSIDAYIHRHSSESALDLRR